MSVNPPGPNTNQSDPPTWTQPPEHFYRRSPSPALSDHNNHAVSPTDSQAPIMESSWKPTSQNDDARPSTVDSAKPADEPYYPPVPLPAAYGTGTAVVNGEVGGSGNIVTQEIQTPTDSQWARYPIAPLSAGLKTSNTTFSTYEEQRVAELEDKARAEDQRDLAVKLKVRLAKVVLRGINCACSLVVLALVASTFAIFNATRSLKPRNGLPPWAMQTPTWPQITIIVIASMSLVLSLFIMYSYWKGGHNRAEKLALHATIFAGAVFIFTIAMWSAGIGIMQASRAGNDDKDLWGWSCKDNSRRKLFEDSIDYTLVCRQQDWVVVCAIIEISVEFVAICVYLFAFYRLFYTKRRLRKSMNVRDEARSSLWLAKLKEQKEAEEDGPDHETSRNTTYNQLNINTTLNINAIPSNDATAFNDADRAEEGRAVPILQPAPVAKRTGQAVPGALKKPPQFAKLSKEADAANLPTGRSVSFMPCPPPGSSGSR